jgi:hypothetical protein
VRNHTFLNCFPLTLADTYGYRPEDIVVLKDLPEFPEQSKPTRVNMVRDIRLHISVTRIEIQPRFVSLKH